MPRNNPYSQKKYIKYNTFLNAWRKRLQSKENKEQVQAEPEEELLKCAVCCVELDTRNSKDHYSSELHKELSDVKHHWLSVGRVHKTLDEQIEEKGRDMPFLGLQYMTQYLSDKKEDKYTYQCTLCKGFYRSRSVFYHVLSIQHRILYLAKHHKSMDIDEKFQVNTRKQYKHLMTCTANAFQQDGMKKIKIVNQVYGAGREVEQGVKGNKGRKKPEPKTESTGVGMDVINRTLGGLQPKRDTDYFRSVAQQPVSLKRPASGRNPVAKDSQPESGSSSKQEDLLKLFSAFLDARAQMNDGDSAVQPYNDGKPAMMQEDPMTNYGPMSHEGPAFRQAGINAPGTVTQAARPGMPQTAKPVAAQPVLPQRRPPATIPFTKGDEGRSFQEFTVAHEDKMKEMGRSEDLNSGSVGEKDDGDSNLFWCNEELYDFLGHLTVESKGDVDYVLKATELLANALVRHKQRTENIKKRIEMEKKKLELEKKAFLSAPGVKELQKKEKARSKSRSRSRSRSRSPSPPPARGAASKRKATADSSSSNKPLFPIGSAPASTEPPSKAKRMMTLSFDSYRPSASARKKSPPRRQSDTKNKQAEDRPGNRSSLGNKPQGKGGANISSRQQRRSSPQANQSRPSDQRSASGQTLNRPQGNASANANPSQQRMQGSQFNQSGPLSPQRPGIGFYPGTANTNASQQRMKDSRLSQPEPSSDQRPAFGQNANRPRGSSTSNVSPSQQGMSGTQFSQSRPTSDPGSAFGPQGSESNFPKRQSRFALKDDDQDLSMRQPIGGSMAAFNQPRQPMQKPASDQSRTLMNETRTSWNEQRQPSNLSWPSTTGSRNPALEGFRSTSKGAESSVKQSQVNQSKPPMNERELQMMSEPPVKETWLSWQGERSEMNEPRRISDSEPSASSWQLKRPRTEESKPNDSEPNFESRPFWQEQRGPSKDQYINNSKSLFTEQRQPLNESRTPSNQPRPSFNEQRLSSNESRPPFNESRPSNQARPSYGASDSYTESNAYYKGNEQYTGSQYANSGSTAGARSSYGAGEGRPEESDAYYTENESYAGSQYSNTGSTGGAKPSYGVGAARQGESDAYYKENERFAGSQYGNSGPAAGTRSSYGPGAGRPQESDAYYQENEQFTDAQYGNTGSTGRAKSSYGPGAGRPGESDSFYKENERFMNAQYGNSGSTGGTRLSYGAGAGRPEEPDAYYKQNERDTNSQYGAPGGAKTSYGTTAGGTEGSKDKYGYNSGYVVAYPLKYSSSSLTVDSQNSERPASLGSFYGMNQGSWSSSVSARSDNFPSKGPGAGSVPQQPYSSKQATTSYDESWK